MRQDVASAAAGAGHSSVARWGMFPLPASSLGICCSQRKEGRRQGCHPTVCQCVHGIFS
ncbi:hypothetical protein HMPREF1316_0436 [Olsenella profusa F0195]|uniref:Uncharacterized protein n=1 Tax=Olsenella profusa F0195 TaxID=1125712 RepID=U2V850_9ACTN|nr:hypothetical protein HMPREF1316_0436 [Olsenella profusa F0195]